MPDGARRVQVPLAAIAALAVTGLPFLRHARNRLVSGQPVGIGAAIEAAPMPALALGLAGMLLLAPVLRPGSGWARWTGLAGVGIAVSACLWLAGQAATHLAATASSAAARTSLGPGVWVLLACLALLGSDTARRLSLSGWRGLAAAVLAVGPLVVLLASEALSSLALLREYAAQRAVFDAAFQRHLLLVAGALVPAVLIGLPLGVLSQRRPGVRRVAMPALNVIQTVPSIALFGLLIGPLSALGSAVPSLGRIGVAGVGPVPAIIALVLYSLLPIVRNTLEGLDGVAADLRDAARGMGMTERQVFWRVEAWLALPVVLSGLRVTTVQAIGLAAVSALIGAGGFGAVMFQGLFANALDLVVLGALPVIALAVGADMLLRGLTHWTRAAVA